MAVFTLSASAPPLAVTALELKVDVSMCSVTREPEMNAQAPKSARLLLQVTLESVTASKDVDAICSAPPWANPACVAAVEAVFEVKDELPLIVSWRAAITAIAAPDLHAARH